MISDLKNKSFDAMIYVIVTIVVIICVLPFLHVLSMSLSSTQAVMSMKVSVFPVGFTLEAYRRVIGDMSMIRSLFLTIEVTVLFSLLGLFLTVALAFPLTRKDFKGKKIITLLVIFTLYFSGGLIPHYVNIYNLGLIDTIWCLILPLALSPFNMIIMKSFIQSGIPDSIEESAKLDGCNHIRLLISIILPLLKPVMATIFLFFAVGRWNAFQDALFYISSKDLYPLQLKLNMLINAAGSAETLATDGTVSEIPSEVVRAASIMFATIPIIIVYPWLQKYFVKGVMLGAVKG